MTETESCKHRPDINILQKYTKLVCTRTHSMMFIVDSAPKTLAAVIWVVNRTEFTKQKHTGPGPNNNVWVIVPSFWEIGHRPNRGLFGVHR